MARRDGNFSYRVQCSAFHASNLKCAAMHQQHDLVQSANTQENLNIRPSQKIWKMESDGSLDPRLLDKGAYWTRGVYMGDQSQVYLGRPRNELREQSKSETHLCPHSILWKQQMPDKLRSTGNTPAGAISSWGPSGHNAPCPSLCHLLVLFLLWYFMHACMGSDIAMAHTPRYTLSMRSVPLTFIWARYARYPHKRQETTWWQWGGRAPGQ